MAKNRRAGTLDEFVEQTNRRLDRLERPSSSVQVGRWVLAVDERGRLCARDSTDPFADPTVLATPASSPTDLPGFELVPPPLPDDEEGP